MFDVKAINAASDNLKTAQEETRAISDEIHNLSEGLLACRKRYQDLQQDRLMRNNFIDPSDIYREMGATETRIADLKDDIYSLRVKHYSAFTELEKACAAWTEVTKDLPRDIQDRISIMEDYELEWFFAAEHWAIDPRDCSLEVFEMLCDLQRRNNDVLWEQFCRDHYCGHDYECYDEDCQELLSQHEKDRLANAEAFMWNVRMDNEYYHQEEFEDIALNSSPSEIADQLWELFDKAEENRSRAEVGVEPEVTVGIDFGNPSSTTHTFAIKESTNSDVLRLYYGEPLGEVQEEEEVWFDNGADLSSMTWDNPAADPLEDLNGLAEKYEALERDRTEPTYTPYKDWEAAQKAADRFNEVAKKYEEGWGSSLKAAQEATENLNNRISTWLARRNLPIKPSIYTDYTEITGVKKAEGVPFSELFDWAKENSEQIPEDEGPVALTTEELFKILFGGESL